MIGLTPEANFGLVGRWVAELVARSLGSNPDISQKYKMGDINKGGANTL
jgi:hypothetical protein